MPGIVIDREKCTLCGECIAACPFSAMEETGGKISINAACKLCKICVKKCPESAVRFEENALPTVDKSAWRDILVFAETENGAVHPVAFELIGKARELAEKIGQKVHAVVIGDKITAAAESLKGFGAERILVYDCPEYRHFRADVFAGAFEAAHLAGCRFVKEHMTVTCAPADIVITSNNGYPLDRNIYQMVKGMDVATLAVKPGGVIIIAGDCVDGAGSESFTRLIQGCKSPEGMLSKMSSGNADIDQWTVQIFARVLVRNRVILVTDKYGKTDAARLFMEQTEDLRTALNMAYEWLGRNAKVNVIPDGPVVIPKAIRL
jgi:NAD-dependent dihydropyrimidine dehydrogenase PreA subunit